MSLKYKVIGIISGLLLSVSVISSIINYKMDVESAQAQLKNISLPLSIDNIYTEIQQEMIEPLIVASLMGNDTFLKDWIIEGEKDVYPIQKYLYEIESKYRMFTSFLVSNITKNYYTSKGVIDNINKNNPEDDWFFDFRKKKDLYEVNLDYNKHIDDSLIMFINYKVKDYEGKLIATTGVGIKLFDIEKMLYSFKNNYRYDVYFASEDGEIILHTKELDKRGNLATIDGLKEIQPAIFGKKLNKFEYKYKDKEYLLSTKYIEQLKLYLFVEVDKKEYMANLQKTFYANLVVSLLVTLLIVLIIIYTIDIYQKQLEQQATEDSLTKLFNRRKFNKELEYMFNLHRRGKIKKLTMVMLDIDNFKIVNDTFGHLVGDKVLVRFSAILKESIRKTDLIARWGGEEFVMLFVDTKKEEILQIIEKLQRAFKEDKVLQDILDKPITASFGFSELRSEDSQDGLIGKVDKALYEAKNSGKDKLVVV